MVVVAQLVRASVCGTEGRRFESGLPPKSKSLSEMKGFFCELQYKLLFIRMKEKSCVPTFKLFFSSFMLFFKSF